MYIVFCAVSKALPAVTSLEVYHVENRCKTVLAVLFAAIVLALVACSSGDSKDNDTNTPVEDTGQTGEDLAVQPELSDEPDVPAEESGCTLEDVEVPDPEEIYEPPMALYPDPPYGKTPGNIIKNHYFRDVANDKMVHMSDLYNPAGKKPKKVLLMNASAGWCSVCKVEAKQLKAFYTELAPEGLEIWFTLFQDYQGEPVEDKFWEQWMNQIDPNYPTLLDVDFELNGYFSVDATPMNMVVDLKTMEIVYIATGMDETGIEKAVMGVLEK